METQSLEPWLRGEPATVHLLLQPVVNCLKQAREDSICLTQGLTADQLWSTPSGIVPIGFQLRHIAGSIGRLASYARGEPLTADQFIELENEKTPGAGRDELLRAVESQCIQLEEWMKTIPTASLTETRTVGRQQLSTTLIALLVHIAEHTQRHIGEALSAARVVRFVERTH